MRSRRHDPPLRNPRLRTHQPAELDRFAHRLEPDRLRKRYAIEVVPRASERDNRKDELDQLVPQLRPRLNRVGLLAHCIPHCRFLQASKDRNRTEEAALLSKGVARIRLFGESLLDPGDKNEAVGVGGSGDRLESFESGDEGGVGERARVDRRGEERGGEGVGER